MTKSTAILLAISALCLALVVLVAAEEVIGCHVENARRGHFWTADFADKIVATGDEQSKRIDFTGLHQFRHVCVVSMYAPGSIEDFKRPDNLNLRDAPRACWRKSESRLTIAGVFADGIPNWTELQLAGPARWYRMVGDACADRRSAVLYCRNDRCGFDRALIDQGPALVQ